MTDKLHEQVSSLVDDELPGREAEVLMARLERDPSLRDSVERYALIGEAMRGTLPGVYQRDLAARVAAAIKQDQPVPGRRFALGRRLLQLRPIAGLAIAASVATLALLTLQAPRIDAPSEVVPDMRLIGPAPLINAQRVDFTGVRSPELQNQLRSYLLNHSEHSTNARLRGVMPYVQIAAHDSQPVGAAVEEPRDTTEKDPEDLR